MCCASTEKMVRGQGVLHVTGIPNLHEKQWIPGTMDAIAWDLCRVSPNDTT